MSDRPRTEPTAEMRTAAAQLWQLHVALTDQGFSDQQALAILGHMLAGSGGKSHG